MSGAIYRASPAHNCDRNEISQFLCTTWQLQPSRTKVRIPSSRISARQRHKRQANVVFRLNQTTTDDGEEV